MEAGIIELFKIPLVSAVLWGMHWGDKQWNSTWGWLFTDDESPHSAIHKRADILRYLHVISSSDRSTKQEFPLVLRASLSLYPTTFPFSHKLGEARSPGAVLWHAFFSVRVFVYVWCSLQCFGVFPTQRCQELILIPLCYWHGRDGIGESLHPTATKPWQVRIYDRGMGTPPHPLYPAAEPHSSTIPPSQVSALLFHCRVHFITCVDWQKTKYPLQARYYSILHPPSPTRQQHL